MSTEDQSRAEFEAWASDGGFHIGKLDRFTSYPKGTYEDSRTHAAWKAWQAARATPSLDVEAKLWRGRVTEAHREREAAVSAHEAAQRAGFKFRDEVISLRRRMGGLRAALEEVCTVLETNTTAIADTVWVSTGQPETLLDHCRSALMSNAAPEVDGAALVSHAETVSAPGASLKVDVLHLTEEGSKCITLPLADPLQGKETP